MQKCLKSIAFCSRKNLSSFWLVWMRAICRFSNILQRLTVTRIIDQFVSKRCQKKRKDVEYKLLCSYKKMFPKKICCSWTVGCQKFVQYIRMLCSGWFILVESVNLSIFSTVNGFLRCFTSRYCKSVETNRDYEKCNR